jgi:hypothetical protein
VQRQPCCASQRRYERDNQEQPPSSGSPSGLGDQGIELERQCGEVLHDASHATTILAVAQRVTGWAGDAV